MRMFSKKTVKDVDIRGKVVLVRTDYNVPIKYDENGHAKILNDFRVRSSLPTLKYLLGAGARKIIIISHLGRPESVDSLADLNELEKLANGARKYSLRPVFNHLIKLLCEDSDQGLEDFKMSFPMNFHSAPIFSSTRYSIPMAEANDNYKIEMLENLRFSKDEKRDSIELAESLAQVTGADLFVQDGFGVVHRAHTSTDAITEVLPSVAGLLLEKEVSTISRAFDAPRRPFVAVMGGAKVGDKLPLIEKFIERADKILIAGAMANTILASRGFDMGRSRVEPGQEEIISDIYQLARQKVGENVDDFIVLPEDVAVAKEFLPNSSRFETSVDSIGKYELALDIGQKTVHKFEAELNNAETIVWNGTVGYAEFDNFANGSTMTAKKIAERTADGALSVVGGGDTSAFVLNWSMNSPEPNDFSLISTGGGAALELMSGAILPGVETLENKL